MCYTDILRVLRIEAPHSPALKVQTAKKEGEVFLGEKTNQPTKKKPQEISKRVVKQPIFPKAIDKMLPLHS